MTEVLVYYEGEEVIALNFESVPRVGELIVYEGDYFKVVHVWHKVDPEIDPKKIVQVEIDVYPTDEEYKRL